MANCPMSYIIDRIGRDGAIIRETIDVNPLTGERIGGSVQVVGYIQPFDPAPIRPLESEEARRCEMCGAMMGSDEAGVCQQCYEDYGL